MMSPGTPPEAVVDAPNTAVFQGTLDLLILKTLSLEPLHGFGIARRIEQISRGVFKVNPGSLLTALQRLERAGWLDGEWARTGDGRRGQVLPPPPPGPGAAQGRARRRDPPGLRGGPAPQGRGVSR